MTSSAALPAATPRRSPDAVTVEFDGEAVVYHEQLGTVSLLNPTATLVWNLLDGTASVEQLVQELADAFGAPVDVVGADVTDAVDRFGRQGLLDGVEADPDVVAELRLRSPDEDAEAAG